MTAPPLDTSLRCGSVIPTRRQTVPSIDVIVPCYNYGRFLRACIGSVLGQLGCEMRLLISLMTLPLMTPRQSRGRSLQKDQRVQVLAHEKNCGHIATYNEGIEWLSADYTLLLSSDDMGGPRGVRALARADGGRSEHRFRIRDVGPFYRRKPTSRRWPPGR